MPHCVFHRRPPSAAGVAEKSASTGCHTYHAAVHTLHIISTFRASQYSSYNSCDSYVLSTTPYESLKFKKIYVPVQYLQSIPSVVQTIRATRANQAAQTAHTVHRSQTTRYPLDRADNSCNSRDSRGGYGNPSE